MRKDAPEEQEREHELGAFAGAMYACAIGLVLWVLFAWIFVAVV